MATFEGPEDNPRDDQPIDQQEYEKWEASQNAGSPQVKVEWLAGFHAGAASRDAEVAELRAPGPCGKHPKACWVERAELTVDELYELEANHPPLIGHTGRPHGKEEECPSSCPCRRAKAHCSVCADISDLRSKIEAARALVVKWKRRVVRLRQPAHDEYNYQDGTMLGVNRCAYELEEALK